jgi:hypothetical protein
LDGRWKCCSGTLFERCSGLALANGFATFASMAALASCNNANKNKTKQNKKSIAQIHMRLMLKFP